MSETRATAISAGMKATNPNSHHGQNLRPFLWANLPGNIATTADATREAASRVIERSFMGTSVAMLEAHYGALLDTAHESLLERLDSAMV